MRYLVTSLGLLAALVKGYDENIARTALYYSKTAYCEQADIENWSCLPCSNSRISGGAQTKVYEYPDGGGQAYVTYRANS